MSPVIKNTEELSQTPLRADALAIAEAGYAAIDIGNVLTKKVSFVDGVLRIGDATYPIGGRRVFFVGVGKCAVQGGRALEALLGDALESGIAVDVSTPTEKDSSKIEVLVGTHPLPTAANENASERIIDFLSGRQENDLIIMLISGGGSTLLCLPNATMTPEDEAELFSQLTAHAAPIAELNVVRKHISRARGGALASASYPAEVLSLIVSDVPGDDISIIASGPSVRDASTVADAQAILEKYGLEFSPQLALRETEKDARYFERVTNTLLLSSQDALGAMEAEAARRGYAPRIVETHFSGEAREVGRTVVETLHASAPKTALLYAGESTVTLGDSSGKGGRNQEMALAALESVQPDELVLPFASDGHDNTDHAGAIGDELTHQHAVGNSLVPKEYLEAHRSYDFFKETGDALLTEPVASNVSDLIVALKG